MESVAGATGRTPPVFVPIPTPWVDYFYSFRLVPCRCKDFTYNVPQHSSKCTPGLSTKNFTVFFTKLIIVVEFHLMVK